MGVMILMAFSTTITSAENLRDMPIIKREVFLQKLAAKIDKQTGMRMKRDIVSIHSPPPAPVLIPGEDQNQSSTAQHCSLRSVNINFDQIGWTHILAPKEVVGSLTFLKHQKLYRRYHTNTVPM